MPPGLWLYLLYCALSCLSLIPAANRIYGLMAAWKFTSAVFIFIGAFHAFRDEEDLRWVLRTHHHDHLHPEEAALLAQLGAPLVQGAAGPGAQVHTDGDILPFGNELVRVLATPGHTASCLSFAWRDRFFCGGLLAVDACPHQPVPLLPEALWDSVAQRVFSLADETLLFAGHERRSRAVSTVQEQRRWHPFFAGLSRDAFLARVSALPATGARGASS